jgi:hypothetical protein
LSSKTEASSAGEQLARDKLDDRQKCQNIGIREGSLFDIFRGLYTFKNPSINFFFLSIDKPL